MVIKCPKCNHYVSDSTAVCPHCGEVLKTDAPPPVVESPSDEEEISKPITESPVFNSTEAEQPEPVRQEELESVTPQVDQTEEVQSDPVATPSPLSAPVATPSPSSAPVAPPPLSAPVAPPSPSSAPVAPPPSSAPVAPPPIAYQQAEKKNTTLIAVIVVLAMLFCGVGGYLYYDIVYLPEKIDRESPRYYTMANMVVLRSSRQSGADYNKLASLPFGTELITYDYDSEWARVKVTTPNSDGKKLEGFVARPYILDKKDFFLLNSIFGNQDSRETIITTKCRIALLDYFKNRGYIGSIDSQVMAEAGITVSPNSDNQWQVFCKPKDAKTNSVLFKRLYNMNSQFTDFAVIISNITNGDRKLLYFYFDDDETPHLLTEQDAPREGYIKDASMGNLNYSGEMQLDVFYSN